MSRDALVVGINRYRHLPELAAPAVDAEAIAQVIAQHGDFHKIVRLPEAIAQTNLKQPTVSATQSVTSQQLKAALKQLFLPASTQAPETALFYFSGHGIPDAEGFDQGYLVTSDTDPNAPSLGISMRWLQWLLSQSPVKQQIVWLDCCHSRGLIVNVGAANPGNGESRDRCFIASSRDFESSWEDLNSPYSVLTKALLDGLAPNRRPNQWIDTFSLIDHVNQSLKGELQTPVCTNFGEAINLTRDWQSPTQATEAKPTDTGICPYKGLEYFDCNDEDPKYFFGRERLVNHLLDHVRTQNFMALVGASGNGKSSVLRAGLLHQLKLGRLTNSDQWRIRITRPDDKPMQKLALAFVDDNLSDVARASALSQATELMKKGAVGLSQLIQASTAPRTILVIDQFEEVFTRCKDRKEREQFFDCLMGTLAESADRLCVIIAMRADFVGKCLEADYSGLARQMQQQMVSVLPMESEELKAAIFKPAKAVSLQVEPALVTEILNDIARAPGSLPLLQYTLKTLWQQRQDNTLQLSAYQGLGGINGTLDQRATNVYNSFGKTEQRTVQHIFQQLTQLGEGTEDTRRRVFQTDLVAAPQHSAARVQQVIAQLADKENRLLVTSEVVSKDAQQSRMAIVDVAHEALIRHWIFLRQWIEQNRDLLRKQRKIEAGAIAWRANNRSSGYLLQGMPLVEAAQFEKQQSDRFPLSDSARIFLQLSQWQRRRSQIKAASLLILPALLLTGVIEHSLRERSVDADYARLDQKGTYEERQAVESLVRGCSKSLKVPYVHERLFGNCRPLSKVPLEKANLGNTRLSAAILSRATLQDADVSFADISNANLSNTNFRNANLSFANVSFANLRNADLSGTNLRNTDFRNANLGSANLGSANLRSADLSSAHLRRANFISADLDRAILLSTNLQSSQNLALKQLNGENHPFLCNSSLPKDLSVDRDRDCNELPALLYEYYPHFFNSVQAAQAYVDQRRQKVWEESP